MMAQATFRYTARTANGENVSGSMQAPDTAAVLALLRSRSLFATSVQRESDVAARLRGLLRIGGVPRSALLTFFRSFVTLVRAGVSIQRALTVTIERTTDAALREALRSVLADVENGSTLSDALGRRPREFPALYVAMIRAGEAGGILDDVLDRLAMLLEREAALARSLRKALAYPLIVLVSAGVLIAFLIARIIPMFADLFASFGVALPPSTRLLLALGNSLSTPLPWLCGAVLLAAAIAAFAGFAATPAGALAVDRARLRIPVFGSLVEKAIVARVSRLLGTLLRSGIELVRAIDAVVPVTESASYARAFERVNAGLRTGEPLASALQRAHRFDPLFLALVGVGEETGLVDDMLLNIAASLEADVASAIDTLGTVLEPVLIIGLGAIVGFIVVSILLPLYTLIGGVSK